MNKILLIALSLLFLSGCTPDIYIFEDVNASNVSLWEINNLTGNLEPINFNNRTVRVFDLIIESPNSLIIGGIQNGTPFASISAAQIDFPAVNASIKQIRMDQSLLLATNITKTLILSSQNQDDSPQSLSITSAGDNVGNGMALFKRNGNFVDPFLGQLLSLNGNMDIMTTFDNAASFAGPNKLRFGFYQGLSVTGNQSIVVTVNNKSFSMEINSSLIELHKPTNIEENLFFRHLNSTEIPSAKSDYVSMYCKENNKCYIKRSSGVERRLVDSGAGSIVFDEELIMDNTTYFNFPTYFNSTVKFETSAMQGVGNAFACLDSAGILYRSSTACI